jgi:VCBS repeat-containing protein
MAVYSFGGFAPWADLSNKTSYYVEPWVDGFTYQLGAPATGIPNGGDTVYAWASAVSGAIWVSQYFGQGTYIENAAVTASFVDSLRAYEGGSIFSDIANNVFAYGGHIKARLITGSTAATNSGTIEAHEIDGRVIASNAGIVIAEDAIVGDYVRADNLASVSTSFIQGSVEASSSATVSADAIYGSVTASSSGVVSTKVIDGVIDGLAGFIDFVQADGGYVEADLAISLGGGLLSVFNGGSVGIATGRAPDGELVIGQAGLLVGTGRVIVNEQGSLGSIVDNGRIEAHNAPGLFLNGNISGTGSLQIDPGATLDLNGSVSVKIDFSTAGFAETLVLHITSPASMPAGDITGFSSHDDIDLVGVPFSDKLSGQLLADNVFRIATADDSSIHYDLHFSSSSDFSHSWFKLSDDGHGGTDISLVDALFTTGTDSVDFNKLTPAQQAAVSAGADLYNALGGGDTITLPNANPTDTSVTLAGTSTTFDLTHPFVLGDKLGDTTTVLGGNGSYHIAAGAGTSTLTVGLGADTLSVSGGGKLIVNSDLNGGSAKIGANSTLELNGTDSGTITFDPLGLNETLRIDGTTMPTGVISGFGAGDTIDLKGVAFDAKSATILQTSNNSVVLNNVLHVFANGQDYQLELDPNQAFSGGFVVSQDGSGGTKITASLSPVTGNPIVTPSKAYSTAVYPYDAVVSIQAALGSANTELATGFVIGPHTILTAAHVALDQFGNVLPNITIKDDKGNVIGPVLAQNIYTDLFVPLLGGNPLNAQHDIAVINVAQNLSSYGAFDLISGYSGGTVNVTGYPKSASGLQVSDIGSASVSSISNTFLEGTLISSEGQSGGPLWTFDSSGAHAVGIVSGSSLGTSYDVQLTPADLSEIAGWENSPILQTTSKAEDGYLSGTTVFADANGNGVLDTGESFTNTDESGSFIIPGTSGPLAAFGGSDTSTGLPFKGQLSAPEGSSVITPLTTLLTALAADPSAQSKLLAALGLPSSVDLTSFDPIEAAKTGDANGAATEVAGSKVYDTVEMIASALSGTGAPFTHALQDAFAALAAALDATGINLSDKSALSSLITQVAHTENLSLATGVADTVASIIAAGTAALDHVLQTDSPGAQLLSDVAGVELVEQGAASTAITNAPAESLTQLQAIASLFTGTNLDHLITQAQTETQNPGQDLGPIAFDGSATTDQNTVLNGTVSAIDLLGNTLIYAVDGSAPAGLTFNSDGTFTFDPGNSYKYLALGQSTDLAFKFTASGGQGTASTGTETITINGLNDPPVIDASHTTATGTITELPSTTGSNATDSVGGVVAFADPDLTDRPTATIDTKDQTVTYQDASGHTYTLTPAQIAAFENALQITAEAGNTNTGKIDWTYSITDKALDFLGAGESVTIKAPIIIDDHSGGTVTQDVTVTNDGSNDNPVAVPDSNGVARGKTVSETAANGVLANDSDPDIHDQLTVEAVNGRTCAVGHAVEGKYGSLTLNADGSYTYHASRDHDSWEDSRHDSGVAEDVFKYTVSDGHGGLSTSTLTFVVFDRGATYLSGANTTLTAGKGPYVLDGSAGGDTLKAGNGDTVLIGGDGDTLIAGRGEDTFVFRPNFGTNTITNFNVHRDTLQFDDSAFHSVRDILAHTTDSPGGAVISDGHGDSVTLVGVTAAQLHHEGFHFIA